MCSRKPLLPYHGKWQIKEDQLLASEQTILLYWSEVQAESLTTEYCRNSIRIVQRTHTFGVGQAYMTMSAVGSLIPSFPGPHKSAGIELMDGQRLRN